MKSEGNDDKATKKDISHRGIIKERKKKIVFYLRYVCCLIMILINRTFYACMCVLVFPTVSNPGRRVYLVCHSVTGAMFSFYQLVP